LHGNAGRLAEPASNFEHLEFARDVESVAGLDLDGCDTLVRENLQSLQRVVVQAIRVGIAGRIHGGQDTATGGGDFLVADPGETLLELGSTVTAENEVGMAVDQCGRKPASLDGADFGGRNVGHLVSRPEPGDGATGNRQRAVLDCAVIRLAGLHRGDAGIGQQQVPFRHRTLQELQRTVAWTSLYIQLGGKTMTAVFAHKALLPTGWEDDVRLQVDDGIIAAVSGGQTPAESDVVTSCIIPGLCNAHSHAFQRALAGRTEERSPEGCDSFWTWRKRMYELAGRMDARLLRDVARQAYTEMLESGYTTVAEFHYLHRDPATGKAGMSMFEALADAAAESGIRLCYIPVLYERAGFDKPQPDGPQQMFALGLQEFLEHHARTCEQQSEAFSVGIGAHSLRAVSELSLHEIAAAGRKHGGPIHLHIAEQQREVDQCMAAHERRPVRWLLENFDVDAQWCLVHSTHMDLEEARALAETGAVVCVCPSTEANLGDGLFPLADFLGHGGRIAIGSDSHISINPFEELRWLEYGQRLATRSRNITALRGAHVGRELFERAVDGGAQASGQTVTGLCKGAPADLVALYDDDPMLTGHGHDSRLDALVFSGYRLPIEGVMVHGEWQVIDGEHKQREAARASYRTAIENLGAAR